jgi:hypothetical protein
MSALVVCLTLGSSRLASASTGSLTFMRHGNVFVTAGDGGAEAQVTSDGTIADPYTSASQSASGVVVAVRHSTAYRLAQSGQPVAAPVALWYAVTGGGAVSADGGVLAYEAAEICGIVPKPCVSTVFRSLSSGSELIGKGLEMTNPTWSGGRVVGAVSGGVGITGPGQRDRDEWFSGVSDTLPRIADGTQYVEAAAASPDGRRLAVVTTPDAKGDRAVWLLTAAGLGQPVTPTCSYRIQASAGHLVWAPDDSAIAVQTASGITTMNVVDLSGTPAGCDANLATTKLIAPHGTYPSWSKASYDPRPINTGLGGNGPGSSSPGGQAPGQHGWNGPGSGGHVAHPPAFAFGSHSLKAALGNGIRIRFSCPDGCTASADARIAAPAAQHFRLGRGATIIAPEHSLKLSRGAAGVLVLRFTRSASVRLRSVPRVTIMVAITLRDSALTRLTRKLSLR